MHLQLVKHKRLGSLSVKLGSFSLRRWKEGIRHDDTPREECVRGRRKAHPSRSHTRELPLLLQTPGSGKKNKRKHLTLFVYLASLLDSGVNLVPCLYRPDPKQKGMSWELGWPGVCSDAMSSTIKFHCLPFPYLLLRLSQTTVFRGST